MHTAIYVKMDAFDDLLLSEGVCRQLGIVEYHPQVDANKPNDDAAVEELPRQHSVFGFSWYNP